MLPVRAANGTLAHTRMLSCTRTCRNILSQSSLTRTSANIRALSTLNVSQPTLNIAERWRPEQQTEVLPLDTALRFLRAYSIPLWSGKEETLEVALAVNTWDRKKKNRQVIRGSVILPQSVGKSKKILVIAEGDDADAATKAGADEVIGTDEIAEIVAGTYDFQKFDLVLTTPEMLKAIRPAARKLRGLTPTVKKGTVLTNLGTGVQKFRNSVEFKSTNIGVCNVGVGKLSLSNEQLKANLMAFLNGIREYKPEDTKGELLQKVTLTTSRGPSARISIKELKELGLK
eukprot:CFRG6559T1